MKLCAATGCRVLIPNGKARCRTHDQRGAYRDPAYTAARSSLLNQLGARCKTCGATSDLTIDHIVPLSRGGTNALPNLQVLCRSCNSGKGALAA